MHESNRSLKVFLCHASADKPAVRDLYQRLESDGVDAWLDTEDLIPGQNWQVEIPNAVHESDVVLVCLSDNSVNKEGYVQKEITFALDKALEMPEGRIFLIPVRMENCQVPKKLSSYQWVDIFSDNGYERLMLALKLRAEQIGAETPGRRGFFSRQASKLMGAKSTQDSATSVPQKETFQRSATNVFAPEPEKVKSRKPFKLTTGYWVAIISVVATVITVVVGSTLFGKKFLQVFEPAVTATIQIQATSTGYITETFAPTLIPTKTLTPAPTSLPTEIIDPKGVEMVLVPEGDFIMGSDSGESNEKPARQVYLGQYYIDKYEVTNVSYKSCVISGVCGLPTHVDRYSNSSYAQHPVVFVDWNMANVYCQWRDGRLPIEAEWVKAARGSDGRTYPWGEEIDCSYANYRDGGNYCVGSTNIIGSYEKGKSPYGVYDMSGNVWEWVEDWYDKYLGNTIRDSDYGTTYRVLRGGAWFNLDNYLRVTYRLRFYPGDSYYNVGFRCAKSVP